MFAVQLATLTEQARALDEPSQLAARLFDEGVRRFEQADHAGSAAAFLDADSFVANAEALRNALVAARRADDPVLIARAAERALARGDIDADTKATARVAMAEAARSVAVIVAQCSPSPCSVQLDGANVSQGTKLFVLPGSHTIASEDELGRRVRDDLSCIAGATYKVELRLGAPKPIEPAADMTPHEPASLLSPPRKNEPRVSTEAANPVHPWVFVASCAGTLVLAGLMSWSGFDTLAAADLPPERYDREDVRSKQRRTDQLLLGTLALGAGTAVVGLWLVDWHPDEGPTALVLPGKGLGVTTRGHF